MAYRIPVLDHSFIAGADLTDNIYYVVKLDANGDVELAGDGEMAIGVLQNDPDEGEVASVMVYGITKAVAGSDFTVGSALKSDAGGKVDEAGAGDWMIGIALEASTADEDIITILLKTAQLDTI